MGKHHTGLGQLTAGSAVLFRGIVSRSERSRPIKLRLPIALLPYCLYLLPCFHSLLLPLHAGSSYTYLWTSNPPLLTGERSATIYFCVSSLRLHQLAFVDRSDTRFVYVGAAIIEIAPNPSSEWNYTAIIHCIFCDDHYFMVLLSRNIPRRQHYASLIPNTLYSVAVIGCFSEDWYIGQSECTIGNSSGYVIEQYLGFVSTRPEGEEFTYKRITLYILYIFDVRNLLYYSCMSYF